MPTPFFRAAIRLSVALSPLLAVGCGAGAYQERLVQNSVPFFSYLQELNRNLGPEARKGDVRLRLPATFKELPAPKKKPNESGGRDPRLPPGLDELPGLVAGFRGRMKAETSDGKTGDVQAYAYVLTNRFLLTSGNPSAKPKDYDKQLLNTIALGLGHAVQATWTTKPYPVGGENFEPSIRYDMVSFDAPGGDVPMRYEVYLRRQNSLIAAVLFVVPKSPARDEQLKNRIDLALQTMRIERPGGSPAAAEGQAAPSGQGETPAGANF